MKSETGSMESTPGLTESSSVLDLQDAEDLKIEKLIQQEPMSEEQRTFNEMSKDKKLAKLTSLVEQSKVFSTIIAETLFQSTLDRKQVPVEEEQPPKKKLRGRSKRGSKFVAVEITDQAKETKQKLETHDIRIPQPSVLKNCDMRDYQLQGMNWLITLYENGLNGILADEMGLGKTLQSISLLLFLYEQGIKGPFLITCPLSTCSNWMNELKRFTPDIPCLSYIGAKDDRKVLREQLFSRNKRPVIVVSSYEIVIRDRNFLEKIDWKFLVVDEGHRLKNSNCLLIKELKKLKTSNRLLLTGTPLQNNLDELWSLLNFILPDIFHDIDLFQQWFDFSKLNNLKSDDNDEETNLIINTEIERNLVTNLHSILKPFLLRRLKRDVIKGLPPKREYIIYANLTQRQTELYKNALANNLKDTLLRQFFKEFLKVNHYKLGSDKVVTKFIEEQIKKSKSDASTGTFIKNSAPYLKSKKRSTRSKRRVLDLDDEYELNKDLLVSDDDGDSDEDDMDLEIEAPPSELEKLWFQVKKEIEGKKLQNLMMQLRLICDSPYLFFFPWQDETKVDKTFIDNSGKLILLNQMLPKLIDQGHKVLIFSQFTRMLDLILDWCDFNGLPTCRIDGSTDQLIRSEQIDTFNNDPEFKVFLLSTRAGGLGLNLTSADTVILFDSDWNPQVDLQAMDRVHRIGQTKPVIIYRFATMNTIEQVLLTKLDSKRKLEKLVISMGKFETIFSKNKSYDKNEPDNITEELGNLLLGNSIFGHSNEQMQKIHNNVLSKLEMEEIFDRSLEAYQKSSDEINNNPKFNRIAIFETVSAME